MRGSWSATQSFDSEQVAVLILTMFEDSERFLGNISEAEAGVLNPEPHISSMGL